MRALSTAAVLLFGPLVANAAAGTVSVRSVTHVVPDRNGSYQVTYDTVVFLAAPGEPNDVSLQIAEGNATLRDVVPVTAGRGCSSVDAFTATCAVRSPLSANELLEQQNDAELDTGDGDDRVGLTLPPLGRTIVYGGDGNDRLEGGANSGDFLIGGPGLDHLDGMGSPRGPTPDRLQGGPDADTLLGPRGTEVDYSDHTLPVRVDLDGDRDDGFVGEGDLVGSDVTGIIGGPGDDELVGKDGGVSIDGGLGADRIVGGSGADILVTTDGVIEAGDGNDFVSTRHGHGIGGNGRDRLYGSDGAVLDGGSGVDQLIGSPGIEQLIGGLDQDRIDGQGGQDDIRVRDGDRDYVECDPYPRRPAGRVTEDALDFSIGCAKVDRAGAALARIFPRGFPIYTNRPRHISVRLGCPDDHRPACSGTIRVRFDGRTIGRGSFRVRAGWIRYVRTRMRSTALDRELQKVGEADVDVVVRMRDSAGRMRFVYSSRDLRAPGD